MAVEMRQSLYEAGGERVHLNAEQSGLVRRVLDPRSPVGKSRRVQPEMTLEELKRYLEACDPRETRRKASANARRLMGKSRI